MNKYSFLSNLFFPTLVIVGMFSKTVSAAELKVELQQPALLLQQISASELGIKPVLNKDEQRYHQLISTKLKAQQYQALLQELSSQIKPANSSAAMAYLLAQLALQQQQFQQAVDYFQQAIKKQPGYGKAYHGLGLAQLQLKQYASANACLIQAMQLGVKDAQLYSYLGYGYLQVNNFHSAVVAYQQAKLLASNDVQLDQALLYAYSQAGQEQAALSLLNQMLKAQPSNSGLWLHRANVLLGQQAYKKAIASLETVIRLNNNQGANTSSDNIALTAQLQLQYGSIIRAQQLYSQIWRQHHKPQLVLDAAQYLIAKQQLASADKLLATMASANAKKGKQANNQQQSQLAYLKGKLLLAQGKSSAAAPWFAKALNFNAVNGQALLAAAQVKRQQGNSHQAQMLLLRASNIESVKLSALTEHADLMMSLGRYQKALELLQQALAFAPHESSIFENVKILERLASQSES